MVKNFISCQDCKEWQTGACSGSSGSCIVNDTIVPTDTIVIINEQHSLLPSQIEILDKKFGKDKWDRLVVPTSGWTLSEMKEKISSFMNCGESFVPNNFVFVSPVPAMMIILGRVATKRSLIIQTEGKHSDTTSIKIFTFHNDKREKKELPGGKIIMVVSQTGWQLV